eukprot:3791936-Rhodomonas_salina.3
METLSLPPKAKVLMLAEESVERTGEGRNAVALAEKGHEVTGSILPCLRQASPRPDTAHTTLRRGHLGGRTQEGREARSSAERAGIARRASYAMSGAHTVFGSSRQLRLTWASTTSARYEPTRPIRNARS